MLLPSPLPPSTLSPAHVLLPASTADAANPIEGELKPLAAGGKLGPGMLFEFITPLKRWLPATAAARIALPTDTPVKPAKHATREG